MEIFLDLSRDDTEVIKIGLAVGAALLALVWARLPKNWGVQFLVTLTVVSGLNYARWGPEAMTDRLDAYDLLHYYVNAKYFDELGYLDLYPAMLVVDRDHPPQPFTNPLNTYLAQDETGHKLRSVRHGLRRGEQVRDKFTDARWEQFEHDVLYLQRTVGCKKRNSKNRCVRELDDTLWELLVHDHGFNGTPAWTLLARPVAQIVPVESLKLLGYLDVVLLGGAVLAVAWAYGSVGALWTALFLLVTYSTRWPYFSWVFLRYDWVAALIFATALLRKGRPVLAGCFAGWTAVLRLFPAMWMWGPFGKGIAGLIRGHVHRPLLRLAAGFVLAVMVLQGMATVVLGPDQIRTHFVNMVDHNDPMQLSSRRIGLALALATPSWQGTAVEKIITQDRKATIEAQKRLRFALAGVMLVALAWGLRRSRDDEAYAFGFLPFFLLTTASYYYYVSRVTLVVVHGGDLQRRRNRVGLASLFALEAFSYWAQSEHDGHRLFLIGTLAWLIWIYAIVQVSWLVAEARTAEQAADAPAA